ncbi:MAG: hypothetical protein A3K46_05455 [Chloroflexi bacterium RBG_13_60_9]|nr:MAG: hypothetical protein A3K46_05455 [Chloroflexi bacterium RBG_13_60_9]
MIWPGSEKLRVGSGVAVFPAGAGEAAAVNVGAGIVATGSGLHAENPALKKAAQANASKDRP